MDDSHPIVQRLAVCDCPESEGKLIVDPTGGPNWKLVSTRSPLVACFPPGINKVTVLQESDESGSRLLEVDFNERKFSGKVPGGGLKHVGSLAALSWRASWSTSTARTASSSAGGGVWAR